MMTNTTHTKNQMPQQTQSTHDNSIACLHPTHQKKHAANGVIDKKQEERKLEAFIE
jgi:hypothetical protein